MTASQSERPASAVWFLLARGGTSTIRITPGLTLREDDQGELQVLTRHAPGGWLRFELEDGALWAQVVSPRWTLGTSKRLLGDRLRLDGSLELVLPHHVFQISESLLTAEDRRRPQVRLVGRPHRAAPNVEPLPDPPRRRSGRPAANPVRAQAGPPTTPAPPPCGSDLQIAIPNRAQESPPTRHVPPGGSDFQIAKKDRALESPPTPPRRSGRPAANPVRAQESPPTRTPSVIRVPAERWRPERQSAPRGGRSTAAASWADSAAIVVFLAALLFSPLAGVPTGGEGASQPGAAGQSGLAGSAGEPGDLIGQAEALLAASPNDRATLEFAVEAYRLAQNRGTEDPGRAARLAELEARLQGL